MLLLLCLLYQSQVASSLIDCGASAIECGFESDFCSFNFTEWSRETSTSEPRGPSGANTGSYYTSFNSNTDGELISKEFDGSSGSSISFYYQMYGSSSLGSLTLDIYDTNQDAWVTLFYKSGNQGSGWRYAYYTVSTNFSYARFTGEKGFGSSTDIAIDDIDIDLPPCPPTPQPTAQPTIVPTPAPTSRCLAGQIMSDLTCVDCPIGQYSNSTSTSPPYPNECYVCDAGYYASSTGNYECKACATGKLSNPTRTAWYVQFLHLSFFFFYCFLLSSYLYLSPLGDFCCVFFFFFYTKQQRL